MRVLLLLAAGAWLLAGCSGAASSSKSSGGGPHVASHALPSVAPADTAKPPRFGLREMERALHRAVNRAREERGRAPLAWSDSLRRLARSHSRDMAQREYFSHTTPEGATPVDRARRLGLSAARMLGEQRRITVAENLFRTYRYAGYRDVYRQRDGASREHVRRIYDWKSRRTVAEETVEGWLESPPHRRTLLSRAYRRHGLGVAFAKRRIYVTQNLF